VQRARLWRVAALAAAGGAAAFWIGQSSGASRVVRAAPAKPLSSLGHLKPAPLPAHLGPELVPIPVGPPLAEAASRATLAKSVDGIKCQPQENVLFHIHAHLTMFVNGKARLIPYGIGIGPPLRGQTTKAGAFVSQGTCFSWLHTHVADGIIHIESPVHKTYTLGEFFDIWGQPLSANQVGPAHGKVTAIVNNGVYTGDPRQIPLLKHAQIQLEVGTPLIAPVVIKFYGPL
jgi:hypothetical protein